MLKVLRKVKTITSIVEGILRTGLDNLPAITISNTRSLIDFKEVMKYVIKNGTPIKHPTKLLDRTKYTNLDDLYVYVGGVFKLRGLEYPVIVSIGTGFIGDKGDLNIQIKFSCLPRHMPKLEDLLRGLLVRRLGGVDVLLSKNSSFVNGKLLLRGHIDSTYGDQKQYIDPDTYNLCDSVFNRMVNDPDYYSRNGLAYKEVILMHGTPGGGKTSLIRHMAVKYNIPIITISEIKDLTTDLSGNAVRIVLLDEIDGYSSCQIKEEGKDLEKTLDRMMRGDASELTFLLNYLDGVIPLHGDIVIYTSNDPDKINPAITRGGRTTLKLRLDAPDNQGILKHVDSPHMDYLNALPEGKLKLSMINKLNVASSLEEVKDIIRSEEDF